MAPRMSVPCVIHRKNNNETSAPENRRAAIRTVCAASSPAPTPPNEMAAQPTPTAIVTAPPRSHPRNRGPISLNQLAHTSPPCRRLMAYRRVRDTTEAAVAPARSSAVTQMTSLDPEASFLMSGYPAGSSWWASAPCSRRASATAPPPASPSTIHHPTGPRIPISGIGLSSVRMAYPKSMAGSEATNSSAPAPVR